MLVTRCSEAVTGNSAGEVMQILVAYIFYSLQRILLSWYDLESDNDSVKIQHVENTVWDCIYFNREYDAVF